MKHKMIALLLVATMAAGALAACGQKEEPEKTSEASKVEESKSQEESKEEVVDEKNFNEEGMPIVDEDITLKVMINFRDTDTNMYHPEDLPIFQQISEETGVNIEWERIMQSDWDTKMNLMWSSGDYPDVIFGYVDVEKYGVQEGVLLPLDDLLEKYVPNVTERMAMENTDVTAAMRASDGNLYAVPWMSAEGAIVQRHTFINKTWLDALDLEMPTDIESLTEVLRAFKTQDPNGNGEADEIPFVGEIEAILYDSLPMFGIPRFGNDMYIDDNKEVHYAPIQDEYRACLEWMHLLYSEGLLDPDVMTNDSSMINLKLADSRAGFFAEWRLTGMGYDEGAAKDCTLFIPENAKYSTNMELAAGKVFLTSANEHPEATMRWVNELLELENMWTIYSGPEFDKKDIESVDWGWYYDDNGLISTGGKGDAAMYEHIGPNTIFFLPMEYSRKVYNNSAGRLEKIAYIDQLKERGMTQKYSNTYFDLCKFDTETNEKVNGQLRADLHLAKLEFMVDVVKNGMTDDKWNDYVALLKEIGYEEYAQLWTDALSKVDVK